VGLCPSSNTKATVFNGGCLLWGIPVPGVLRKYLEIGLYAVVRGEGVINGTIKKCSIDGGAYKFDPSSSLELGAELRVDLEARAKVNLGPLVKAQASGSAYSAVRGSAELKDGVVNVRFYCTGLKTRVDVRVVHEQELPNGKKIRRVFFRMSYSWKYADEFNFYKGELLDFND